MTIGNTSPIKIKTSEKRAMALDLRKNGYTLQEIGDNLQCSFQYAHRLVSDALAELVKYSTQSAEELRELESTRLDALWEKTFEDAKNGNLSAINTCIRISERRSKLYGLDGTQKIEHSGGVNISLILADCSKKEDECNTTHATKSSSILLPDPKE